MKLSFVIHLIIVAAMLIYIFVALYRPIYPYFMRMKHQQRVESRKRIAGRLGMTVNDYDNKLTDEELKEYKKGALKLFTGILIMCVYLFAYLGIEKFLP